MTENLKRTALFDWHVAHGGRMVPFAGWEMPVQYNTTGPIQEHEATRNNAGLFDIDHMGQLEVRGPDAEAFVNYMLTYDVSRLNMYESHYGFFCYADGTVVDDLFVSKLPDPKAASGYYFLLAVNASNRDKDVAWVNAHTQGFDVEVKDISDETYMVAFQGPKAVGILNSLAEADLEQVPRFSTIFTKIDGVEAILGRTGYTGEDGFEIFFPVEKAVQIWEAILKAGESEGAIAIGLAARDSLRFESCMPLYGHELSDSITPVEAGLNFAVSYDKNFIGRDALLKQRLEKSGRISVAFELVGKGVAREHYAVAVDGKEIGMVTSGMFTPTTKKYVGMALIERGYGAKGAEIDIMIRGKAVKAKVVKKPFYVPTYRR